MQKRFVLITITYDKFVDNLKEKILARFLYEFPDKDWNEFISQRKNSFNKIWGENNWAFESTEIIPLSQI